MQIGIVGLGRMGGNMARRLRRAGVEIVGFDTDAAMVASFVRKGAEPTGRRRTRAALACAANRVAHGAAGHVTSSVRTSGRSSNAVT
jgi:6-phosphogluconate dehydrogenase